MSQFWVYFELGLDHVLDWQAYDHVLFLVVLVASHGFATWKRVLGLVTLFTIGHTLALFLSVYKVLEVNPAYVEFLIPITILATAIFDIITSGKKVRNTNYSVLYFTTGFFGLVHGLGFICQSLFKVSKRDWVIVTASIVIGIILPILQETYLAL